MQKLMRLLMRAAQIFMIFAMASFFQACGSDDQDWSQLNRASSGASGTGTKTGKCKVVSGPNKGKTGSFDSEGWCMGDWGGTECQDSSGKDNGKCQAVKKVIATTKPVVASGGLKLNN